STPGVATRAPASWPTASALVPAQEGHTLVVFAHPRCPCTRATMSELARLLARVSVPRVYVAFLAPRDAGPDWIRSDLWRSATHVPGVQAVADLDVQEAARFGARTSGATVLYDA